MCPHCFSTHNFLPYIIITSVQFPPPLRLKMPSKQDLGPIHLCHPVTEITAPTLYMLSKHLWVKTWWVEEWRAGRTIQEIWRGTQCNYFLVVQRPSGEAKTEECPVSALQHSQGQLTVILVSLRLSRHTQFTSHRRSQGKPPGTIVLSSQNTDFWLNKISGFLGKGVWAVDLWGAMNAFANSCLSINS